MKIVKNTSEIPTAFLRKVFSRVHQRTSKVEGKLKCWKFLKVTIRQGKKFGSSGYAYFNYGPITLTLGRMGDDHYHVRDNDPERTGDVGSGRAFFPFLKGTIPGWTRVDEWRPNLSTREIADLFFHEVMHVYGYKHGHGCDPGSADLDWIMETLPEFPERIQATSKAARRDLIRERYERLLMRRVSWAAKAKRAENALTKVERDIRVYENRHGSRLNVTEVTK